MKFTKREQAKIAAATERLRDPIGDLPAKHTCLQGRRGVWRPDTRKGALEYCQRCIWMQRTAMSIE